jgi:lipoate-protein ligase B
LGTRCTLLRPGIVDYERAWELQQRVAADVRAGSPPTLILLQHPPTYTLGVRGSTAHVLEPEIALAARGASVVRTDRGGDVTFHGPGQCVAYPIIDLRDLGIGPAAYVRTLEQIIIDVLAAFGLDGARSTGRPGVWVRDAKIAAIGVRISGGVSTHGFALNVTTDLSWFEAIVPCGISDAGVTSMARELDESIAIDDVESNIAASFARIFDAEMIEDSLMEAAVGR